MSTLTLLSLAFILVMLIFFSMKISRLNEDLKKLAQEVALRTVPNPAAETDPPDAEKGAGVSPS